MTRITPAPWQIKRHYDAPNTYTPFIEVGPARICFTQGYHTAEEDAAFKARAEADAALVGAAPDLLEAAQNLRAAQRAYLADRGNKTLVRAVREAEVALDAAIALATGALMTRITRHQNPVDVLEQIATNAGFEIEPESFAAARDYVKQEVQS